MIKTDNISIDLFEFNGNLKVIAQFGLNIPIEKDSSGRMSTEKKRFLQKALEEALSKWEFDNV
jgi:hypothetical protein